MKKTIKLSILSILATFFFLSCTTMVPVRSDVSYPADASTYEILGRVLVNYDQEHSGYSKLLEAAKDQYPEADDVVNIIVDAEYKTFLGLPISATYTMSGIAIDYK